MKRMNLHSVCHRLSWEILLAAVQNCSGNDACWFCGSNGGNWGLGGMWQGSKRASFFIRQCIFFSQRMLTNKRFSGERELLLTQWIMQADSSTWSTFWRRRIGNSPKTRQQITFATGAGY